MPPFSLADLRSPESQATIRARLVAELQAGGAPVADWIPSEAGGVENIRLDVVSGAMAYWMSGRVAELLRDGLLELATGDGLTFYARQRYKTEKNVATKTVQNIALWLVGGSAKTFKAGDLICRSQSTGNRYILIEDVAVTPDQTEGAPVFARFEAEAAGTAYADVAGTVTQLVTAPSGLRCINKRPSDFLPTRNTGTSSGTVQGSLVDPTATPSISSIRVWIKASGDLGTATFSVSIDGGHHFDYIGAVGATYPVGGGGATLTFSNGSTPSFIVDDIFTLLVADEIAVRGADEESPESLRQRCRGKWATLSDVPVGATIELLAHLASREVDRVYVDASAETPGGILVTVASSQGEASPGAVLDVQDYIQARLRGYRGVPSPGGGFLSPEETVLASSAKKREILASGTVDVPRAKVAEVQQAAQLAWLAYLRSLPIGVHPDAVVRVSELVQAVMDAGARDIQGARLNSGLTPNITLEQHEVAVPRAGTSLLTSLTWRPV